MSTGIITFRAWDFDNDDTIDSTEQNPTYTFNVPGNYTANLTAANYGGNNTVSDHIMVNTPAVPAADFTADTTNGIAPLTVYFTGQSTGVVTAWAWDFNNDGKTDATTQNATYTYSDPGIYTVNLTVTNAGGSNSTKKADYINVTGIPPIADFSADVTTGKASLKVNFTDNSTGSISGWAWDFDNDGAIDAAIRNASYTYPKAGNYTVNLTVTGPAGSNSAVKTDYIQVLSNIDLSGTAAFVTSYPNYENTVRVTVTNSGTENAAAFNVTLLAGENSTALSLPELTAGNSTTFSIIDIKRKLGDLVPITVIVDPENTIVESNETNNEYKTSTTIVSTGNYYTGGRYYTGNDLETGAYQEGNIAVKYSQGDSGYKSGGGWYSTTVHWTGTDLPIPANATVKEARLYQSYTWNYPGNPGFSLQFNGNTVNQTAFYGDGTDNFNGQVIFDVTPYFNKNGNTAIINASNPGTGVGGLYGAVLVVIYEDASEPYRMIWLDEGCDTLLWWNR